MIDHRLARQNVKLFLREPEDSKTRRVTRARIVRRGTSDVGAELITNCSCRGFFDLSMTGYGCTSPICRISINRVIGPLAIQVTSILFQVANKIATLHAAGRSTEIVSQIELPGASLAAFSR